jgi:hypothetical protein
MAIGSNQDKTKDRNIDIDRGENKSGDVVHSKHMDRKARQSSIFLSYSPMTANNCTHPTSLSRVYFLVPFSNTLAKTVAQGAGKPAIYSKEKCPDIGQISFSRKHFHSPPVG